MLVTDTKYKLVMTLADQSMVILGSYQFKSATEINNAWASANRWLTTGKAVAQGNGDVILYSPYQIDNFHWIKEEVT